MTNKLVPFEQQQVLAASVAKSGLFGIKTQDQALVLMALCEAENLHPAVAMRDYHIIQGRPALKADAMLARFQTAGGKVRWTAMTDTKVSAVFSHPQGGEVEIEWTAEMVKRAQINNDMHRKYPRQMLRARCISEGIRTVFPGVVVGTYTPEEVEDMEPVRQPMKDVTPPPTPEWLQAALEAIKRAGDMEALKAAYDAANKAAKQAGDVTARPRIVQAKDARKAELAKAAEPAPAEPEADAATIDHETGEVI